MTTNSTATFDVIVVGAGCAGLAAALGCVRLGLRVALVSREAPRAPATPFDLRIYALTPGNARWLGQMGAWARLDPGRVEPVLRMEISAAADACLRFDARAAGAAELAWIIEEAHLQKALRETIGNAASVFVEGVSGLTWNAHAAHVRLGDGSALCSSLVIAADGAASPLRNEAGIDVRTHRYGETGVVANFRCERPHGGTARQWFREDGVVAWLPLPGRHVSLVWSAPDDHAGELVNLAPDELAGRAAEAGAGVLGRFEAAGPAGSFALRRQRAARMTGERLALVGDAAHVVHPLAGQGMNLALRDVRDLCAAIAARKDDQDPGAHGVLRAFERARAEDVASMEFVTDSLDRLFSSRNPALALLRRKGLALTDRFGPVKRLLTEAAMR